MTGDTRLLSPLSALVAVRLKGIIRYVLTDYG
jgi:hypothetical protein